MKVQQRLVAVAAWSSLVAGVIHLVVVPEHWRESPLYGGFFVGTTVAQVALAVLLARRSPPWLLAANIAVQLGLVALWAVTRTAGIPLGPEAGEVETIGLLDSLCVAAQLVSAAAAAALLLVANRPAVPAARRRTSVAVGG